MSAGEAFPGVCTDWRRHDVPAMWQMLANEDGQHSWDQVTGWRQISELLNLHSGRLRTAREQLAASWPAGGSGAASVFMAFVDQLLGSMDGTATVAAGNSAALAGITTSLGTAREAMEQLHDQWQRYAEAEHHSTEPTIRRGSPGVLEPRLSQDWRQDLNQQGATVMTAMENEVLDYAPSTTVPAAYTPLADVATIRPDSTFSSDVGALDDRPHSPRPSATRVSLSPLTQDIDQVGIDRSGPALVGASANLGDPLPMRHNGGNVPTRIDEGHVAVALPSISLPHWDAEGSPTKRPATPPGVPLDDADHSSEGSHEQIGMQDQYQYERDGAMPSNRAAPGVPSGSVSSMPRGSVRRPYRPETEWRIGKGVPPVIQPRVRKTRHDPGPGVIGIVR